MPTMHARKSRLGLLDAIDHAIDVALGQRAQQGFLAGKVIKQSSLADAGRLRDSFERHASGADIAHDAFGGLEDPLTRRTDGRR
jgi:hypothetical protein